MLRVDPEPFESLTAPRKIEGWLFLPCSSERGLSAVEGSRNSRLFGRPVSALTENGNPGEKASNT